MQETYAEANEGGKKGLEHRCIPAQVAGMAYHLKLVAAKETGPKAVTPQIPPIKHTQLHYLFVLFYFFGVELRNAQPEKRSGKATDNYAHIKIIKNCALGKADWGYKKKVHAHNCIPGKLVAELKENGKVAGLYKKKENMHENVARQTMS